MVFLTKQNVNEVNFRNNDIIPPPPTTDEYCEASHYSSVVVWSVCSPPQDQEKLMIMNTMKYKKDQLKAYRNTANTLLLEQICHLCCGKFSKTLAISTIAKILSWVVHTTTMLDSFLVLMFVYILGSIY